MAHEKLYSLQILRAVAASVVVYHHADHFSHYVDPSSHGLESAYSLVAAAGVDIFFCLSGAIIYLTAFAERRMPARLFIRKRIRRIAPIYYAVILAWAPIAIVIGWKITGASFAATFFFVPFAPPILGPAWSLPYEMLFYTGAALLLALPRAVYVVIAIYCLSWYFSASSPLVAFLGSPLVLEFGFGIAIAMNWQRLKTSPGWFGLYVVILGFAALIVPVAIGAPDLTNNGVAVLPRVVFWGIPSAIILIGAMSLECYVQSRRFRWAVFLGDASYSIYLAHYPVMAVLALLISARGLFPLGALAIVILFFAGIATGVIVHVLVEAPLLRLLRERSGLALKPAQVSPHSAA